MNNNDHDDSAHDCEINSPECYSPNTVDPWETDYAALVPRFTGSLSAVSSALIIYVILRSEARLSSIYHRIMFGMSLADICGSIAMALTSLPMPSYMPKEEIFGYMWAGTRLGNTYTCNAQGFFAFFGMGCMFHYNGMLCVYYACAIAFTMREKNIKKYVEPILHGYPIVISLLLAVPPLFYEMYNPGITAYPWCGPFPYPDECAVLDGVECIRGSERVRNVIQFILPVSILLLMANIVLPLALVIYKVIQTDRIVDQISKVYNGRGNEDLKKVLEKHRNTKAVLIQASSYVAAFLFGSIPPFIMSLGIIDSETERGNAASVIFPKLFIFFFPLQGFFNCIIFITHKVYNYQRVHRDVSICRVLAILFFTSVHDPYFISRISFVNYHEEEEGEQQQQQQEVKSNLYDFGVQDESNQELHFRLGLMKSSDSGLDAFGLDEECVQNDGNGYLLSLHPTFAETSNDTTCSPLDDTTVVRNHKCEDHNDQNDNSCSFSYSNSDNSSWISFPSRTSLNISLRHTDLSLKEERLEDHDGKKYYYRHNIQE